MGNTSSVPLRVRRRRTGAEPTTTELLYTKPSGLYPTCAWEAKAVRRLILRGELAPRYPGRDEPSLDAREECPICMLVYPVLNETRCCAARLCTECYLQIRPPRHNKEPCPFCKYKRVEASYKGPRDHTEIDREEQDERRALEAMKRANLDLLSQPTHTATAPHATPPAACCCARHTVPHPHPGVLTATPSTLPCTCQPACQPADRPICGEDHRARYYHADKAPVIDPLLLEAMASEVTFSSAASSASHSALDRASASSSGVLDSHTRDLRGDLGSESEAGSSSFLAMGPPRVVRLPWYGIDLSQAEKVGPSSSGAYGTESDDEIYQEDEISLKEAIRRSLVDM